MNIKDTLDTAQQLMNQKQLEQADALYCSILEQQPGHVRTHLQRGKILRLQAKPEEALNYFKATMDMHPEQPLVLCELANELRNQKYYEEAEEYYRKILSTVPQYFHALIGLGISARRQALHEQALSYFQKAVVFNPERIGASLQVAEELRLLNRMSDSDALYQRLLKQAPTDFSILQGLALNARKLGCREGALSLFKQQAIAHPEKLQAQLSIAIELRALDRLDEADIVYHKVLKKESKHLSALRGLAINTRQRGDRQAALIQFQNLLQLYPEQPQSILDVTTELRELGQFDGALVCLQRAAEQFPENFSVPLQQGHVYRQQGERKKSLSYFQKASSLQPLNQQIKLQIATEYFVLGEVNSAIESIQEILERDPQHLGALMQLGNWQMNAREFDAAQSYFQQALEFHPQKIQPYLQSSQAFLELGESEKCFAMLDKAMNVIGNKPELYHKRIQILWLIRQIDSALTIQAEAVRYFPEHYPLRLQQINFQIERGLYQEATDNIAILTISNHDQMLMVKLLKARILKEQWRLTEALQQYQAILDDYSHCQGARQAILLISLINMDIKSAREQAYILGQNNLGMQKIKGQNRSYRHNHHAKLMDEYVLNRVVLQQIHSTLDLPLEQRLQAIVEIVLAEPEATSAAVTLLVQLRQAGYYDVIKVDGEAIIPKKVFQYWDKPNPPEEVLAFTQSWQRHHPDYDYQLFDEQKACRFLQRHYPKRVLNCYLRCKHAAQKADVLRLALLAHYGGIYADADDYCLQPLDPLLVGRTQLILRQEDKATVGNNFIAVTASHPVMTVALELAIDAMERGDNDSIWLSTGPGLVSRSLAHYLALQWPEKTPRGLGITVMTQAELFNYVAIHGKLAYKSTKDSWLIKEFSQGSRIELKGLIPTKANNA